MHGQSWKKKLLDWHAQSMLKVNKETHQKGYLDYLLWKDCSSVDFEHVFASTVYLLIEQSFEIKNKPIKTVEHSSL